jgi:hypothetical protein
VRSGDSQQLLLGFRECDVKAGFAETHAFEKKLKGKGRFTHAGVALDKIKPMPWQAAAQDFIQSWNTRGANFLVLI